MRIAEIVGGAALVGVAVLLGIALIDEPAPESTTADTSPFVFATSTSSTASTASTTSSTGASTSTKPGNTTTSIAAVSRTTLALPATTSAATSEATTPVAIPPEQRAGIAVRVINGGARARAATMMSDVLRSAGFAPPAPADARGRVAATTVIFAPGRELEAATVNEVVGARPENVIPAAANDPNWTEFGDGLAVLVVLGPA